MSSNIFTELEIDAIGEILNISLGSSATAASTMLSRRVEITTPKVQVVEREDFELREIDPAIGVEITYVTGLSGRNVMLLCRKDVKAIVEILMYTTIPDEEFELDEMNLSAIREVMNQMMGASATALSEFTGELVNISTPVSFELANEEEFKEKYFDEDGPMVVVSFNFNIEDAVESEFLNVMPISLAKELIKSFGVDMNEPVAEPVSAPVVAEPVPVAPTPVVAEPAPVAPTPVAQVPVAPAPVYQEPKVLNVQPLVHNSFDSASDRLPVEQKENLDLIMDVPLEVSVEIGRTRKLVKDILELTSGSLVVLDRLAGEQIDLYVNGQCIAKGDVVVVDDNFAIRVTEIIKKADISSFIK